MLLYHRIFRVCWLLPVIVASVVATAWAQSPLTCCNDVAQVPLPKYLSNLGHWRLGGGVGLSQQYQGQRNDQSLYLGAGLQTTLNVDYFLGRHWGIGATLGFENLSVRDQYVQLAYQDPTIPANFVPAFLPKAGMQSLQALVGPVVSIPLFRRLTIDLSYKGGVFYNNAPVVGAFDPTKNVLVFRISPNYQRFGLGMMASGNLVYRLTPRWQIGLGGTARYSRFGYTVDRTDGRFFQFMRRLGVLGGQVTLTYTFESRAVPMAPAVPTCYPPVLDTSMPTRHEIGTDSRPVLKWQSSAPVYTDDQRYVVRLYSMPENKLLAENTVRDTQWAWPAKVALPDTSSFYFFSVHSTRTDNVEQICRSELTTGTLEFYKRIAVVLPPTPENPNLTIELFEVLPILGKVTVAAKPRRTVRQNTKRRAPGKGANSAKTRTYSKSKRPSAKSGSQTGIVAVRETLIYREVTRQRDIVWPAGVQYPIKPTMYRYVIRKTDEPNKPPLGEYNLLVEPGGAVKVLTPAEKQSMLKGLK